MSGLSTQAAAVLDALRAGHSYGHAIMRRTGLKSGSVYPILARMREAGWVTSRQQDTGRAGRPPRRIYEVTSSAPADTRTPVGACPARE